MGITDRYRAANEATFWQWDATGHAKVALKVKDGADMVRGRQCVRGRGA